MFNLFKKRKKQIKVELTSYIDYDVVEPCLPDEYIREAVTWYYNHKEHVHNLMLHDGESSFEPYWEDKSQPSLWKGGSWRWFFGEYEIK